MFSEMITCLTNNKFPDKSPLKGRLHIALIKKEAIFALPHNFRVSDPKMNPRSDHMIWAAVLIEDKDLFDLTTTILFTEKSMLDPHKALSATHQAELVEKVLTKLLALPTNKNIQLKLQETIQNISRNC